MKHLKLIRSIIGVLSIMLMGLVFLNLSWILDNSFAQFFVKLQFLPSLLSIGKIVGFSAIGFILFSILAFLIGRVYCSTICPLGILQDVFIRISKLFRKKIRYNYRTPKSPLRFILLVVSVFTLLIGSSSFVLLIDPYSNFGRISTHLFQPIYLLLNNIVAFFLNKVGVYSVYHINFKIFHISSFLIAIVALFTLITMTFSRGRLFCNSICPVGTFLGLISKYAIFKLKFNESTCISCGKCEKACKAESIDYKSMKIDFDRCITCYNCVDVCPTNAIAYTNSNKKGKNKADQHDAKKRENLKALALSTVAISNLSFIQDEGSQSSYTSKIPATSEHPIMPPGAINIDHFKQNCTSCHLCVSACPSNVIQPTFAEYGIDGLFIPRLNYAINFCQYECNTCSTICPTSALSPISVETKKQTQIGKVVFIEDNCVVKQNGDNCGACAEHCPTTAVKMVPFEGHPGLNIPQVDTSICIGCGACEYPCPARPHKAIFVESNSIHQIAEKPQPSDTKQKIEVEEEFPF